MDEEINAIGCNNTWELSDPLKEVSLLTRIWLRASYLLR